MNRPMTYIDGIHLHGMQSFSDLLYCRNQPYVGIGLTNKDPNNLRSLESIMDAFRSTLQRVELFQEGLLSSEEFDLRIALRRNATLSIRLNGNIKSRCYYPEVSTSCPIWLVIQPIGINSIKISNIIE